MISIDPGLNTERDNYKFLIGSVIPRPIAFVTTLNTEGAINGAPFSYFNVVSSNPPMLSLSIQRNEGLPKDTARNIIQNHEFVVHIVDEQNVAKINETAKHLPSNESEIELADFSPVESIKVSVPGVKEAKIRMECILEDRLELGGTEAPGCDLLIGRVVQFHIEEALYTNGRIDSDGLQAVSRLAGDNYATIGRTFAMQRPK